ncbi:MAG: hypothetical protein B7W98_02280 [Parcubacteria group bacterium 20-58-5]|nr:MAG: hypothetical protein B7W98_02280 [Parcubacteria group bacterium 20-58-5]OYV63338.1 MAG: hypothetical protein B7X03_02245 [Parcubacteria group bacterium 21-58-10]
MFEWFFNWFRPKAKFGPGNFTAIGGNWDSGTKYLGIREWRWERWESHGEKQWVYYGLTFRAVGNRLERIGPGSAPESQLFLI